jgi:hypothetical protein
MKRFNDGVDRGQGTGARQNHPNAENPENRPASAKNAEEV